MNSTGSTTAAGAYPGSRSAAATVTIVTDRNGTSSPSEFDNLVADAEDLVQHTVDSMGSQTAAARAKLKDTLGQARNRIAVGAEALGDQGRQAARAADDYIRERPWQSIGVAAVVGLAIGVLLSRR